MSQTRKPSLPSRETLAASWLETLSQQLAPANTADVWEPLPGPQRQAYDTLADETFYGGAAGGGKTDLLLGLALTRHRKSIIFRREYPQLRDVISRSRDLALPLGGMFNAHDQIWRLPGGRTVEFGAAQHPEDVQRYQGRAHDLKAFDEITHFTEQQYRFLIGWARTTTPGQRVRIVCAGNPPTGAEGEWVIRRWAPWLDPQHPDPARPGDLRWFATIDGEDTEVENGEPLEWKGETITPKSRTFIPARLTDNPFLMATDYAATLQAMPEPLRSQMLYGDFGIGREDDAQQVIPTAWVREAMARWKAASGPEEPLSALGVDVARGGRDKTTIARRFGSWFAPLLKYPGAQTPDGPAAASLVLQAVGEAVDDAYIHIDVIGVGASVYDVLKTASRRVVPVNAASRNARARDRSGKYAFLNTRAEDWWRLREALDPLHGNELALPPDQELLADLCAPRWTVSTGGIQVESRDDIIRRLGRSPDVGTAVVLANRSGPPPIDRTRKREVRYVGTWAPARRQGRW